MQSLFPQTSIFLIASDNARSHFEQPLRPTMIQRSASGGGSKNTTDGDISARWDKEIKISADPVKVPTRKESVTTLDDFISLRKAYASSHSRKEENQQNFQWK